MTNLSDSTITVTYTTTHNTTETADYVSVSGGTISWSPETNGTQTIDIVINDDSSYEGDESFYVDITASAPASVTTSRGTVTILDDETPPELSIIGTTVTEGSGGITTPATISVTLSDPSESPVLVQYYTSDESGDTATENVDYSAITLEDTLHGDLV